MCSTCQRYKMKGNHNDNFINQVVDKVVFNMSKIQNERKSQLSLHFIIIGLCCVQHVKDTKWKEITTITYFIPTIIGLCSTCQRYKMKGNHNSIALIFRRCKLCSTCQRYKMKGNHNNRLFFKCIPLVVFNMSKIQNERKSQLLTN